MFDVIDRLGYGNEIRFHKEGELHNNLNAVNSFLFDPPMGQIRGDCVHRKFTMVGFSLGREGDTVSKEEKIKYKAKVINDIYIGEESKNHTYTILGLMYIDFLKDILHGRSEIAWLCTGSSLTRQEIYEGPLDKLLEILEGGWGIPYEWTLTSSTLHWAVDYNHHKSMVIIGDVEANRAYNRLARNKWKTYCLDRNLYPRQN
jgi:hypothetical protein